MRKASKGRKNENPQREGKTERGAFIKMGEHHKDPRTLAHQCL